MIVGCPGRELLGASLGIILKAAEGFDRVDRGKRVLRWPASGAGSPN